MQAGRAFTPRFGAPAGLTLHFTRPPALTVADLDEMGWKPVGALGFVRDPPYTSAAGKEVTGGANLRTEPEGDLIRFLPFGTKVRVLREKGSWLALQVTESPDAATTGLFGFVANHLIWRNPPDPDAQLYAIQPGDGLQDVVEQHGPYQGYVTTGDDARSLVMAVYIANLADPRTASNIRLNKDKFTESGSAWDYFDEYRAKLSPIFKSIELIGQKRDEERKIWLPGRSYVDSLKASGIIPTRPEWKNTAIKAGKGIAGFTVGIVEGFAQSIADVFIGAYELLQTIVDLGKKILTGAAVRAAADLIATVREMSTEDVLALGKQLLEALAGFLVSSVKEFVEKWTDDKSPYRQWNFRGRVVGYLLAEVAMIVFTGAALNAVKWIGKFGKLGSKLSKILKSLGGQLGDLKPKKMPDIDIPKDRVDAPDTKRRKGESDSTAARSDKSDKKQRELPIAMMAAASIAETHDERGSSIPVLLAMLQPLRAKFTWIKGFGSKRRRPGEYQVLLYASEHVVDKSYTPKSTTHEIPEGGTSVEARTASGHKPPPWVKGREDLVYFSDGRYRYRPGAQPETTGAPRMKRGDSFDPGLRRPNLSEFSDVSPSKVDRHSGVRTRPDAGVSVWHERLPKQLKNRDKVQAALEKGKGELPREARIKLGHQLEDMLVDDHRTRRPGGTPLRVAHEAGDKKRVGDIGRYEVTIEGQHGTFSDKKLDQLWRDMIDHDRVHLTVPKIHPDAEKQLAHMVAVYKRLSGRKASIAVRELLTESGGH